MINRTITKFFGSIILNREIYNLSLEILVNKFNFSLIIF